MWWQRGLRLSSGSLIDSGSQIESRSPYRIEPNLFVCEVRTSEMCQEPQHIEGELGDFPALIGNGTRKEKGP